MLLKEDNIINKFLSKQFSKKVQMAAEFEVFDYNSQRENITLFNVNFTCITKGDHTPQLSLTIEIFNWTIIDAMIHNVHHEPVLDHCSGCLHYTRKPQDYCNLLLEDLEDDLDICEDFTEREISDMIQPETPWERE